MTWTDPKTWQANELLTAANLNEQVRDNLSFIYDQLMPPGTVIPYAGNNPPANAWLVCDGSAVSRNTYSALYAVIGDTYGAGDGSTTFNLPDLRGRVVAGQDDMGGTSANRLTGNTDGVNGNDLGNYGGNETQTLIVSQLPPHTHGLYQDSPERYAPGGSGRAGNIYSGSSVFTSSTGNGDAHNNVQPTLILNYLIRY